MPVFSGWAGVRSARTWRASFARGENGDGAVDVAALLGPGSLKFTEIRPVAGGLEFLLAPAFPVRQVDFLVQAPGVLGDQEQIAAERVQAGVLRVDLGLRQPAPAQALQLAELRHL